MAKSEGRSEKRVVAGALLIMVGIALFVLQFVEGFGQAVTFIALGGAFLLGYAYRPAYGLLIPACILLGLGIGSVGENLAAPLRNFSDFGLGIGFAAIYVIDRFQHGKSHWWPLIPGIILIINGLTSSSVAFGRLVSRGWPMILVIIGVLVLAGVFGKSRQRE
jgi:hypothetical protein